MPVLFFCPIFVGEIDFGINLNDNLNDNDEQNKLILSGGEEDVLE